MNIIFGKDSFLASEKYITLELDTFRFHHNDEIVRHTAYCVVELLPILDLPRAASMQELHENLMVNYRKRDWNYCTQAIEHLYGFWGKELDSFYDILLQRLREFEITPPDDDWDGTLLRQSIG